MNGNLKGKLRLQKLTCLLEAEGRRRGTFQVGYPFELHYYGPFSRELGRTVEELVSNGYLAETPESTPSGNVQFAYSLTPEGRSLLYDLLERTETSQEIEDAVRDIVSAHGYLRAQNLVELAYKAFHEQLEQSSGHPGRRAAIR
jgi:uncharacterized protein YwgA